MEEFNKEDLDEQCIDSVTMLLEHSKIIHNIEETDQKSNIYNSPAEMIAREENFYNSLCKIKKEIKDGIASGKIFEEFQSVIFQIDNIQKELQIQKLKKQQEKFRLQEEKIMADWIIIDKEVLERETSGYMASLRETYASTCQQFNVMRKPAKPIFKIMEWVLKIYSGGYYCVVPILLKLLAD